MARKRSYWRCPCGAPNQTRYSTCLTCGRDRGKITEEEKEAAESAAIYHKVCLVIAGPFKRWTDPDTIEAERKAKDSKAWEGIYCFMAGLSEFYIMGERMEHGEAPDNEPANPSRVIARFRSSRMGSQKQRLQDPTLL